ncbi:MAG TPA: hypothetical protein ACFE0H_02025 [Elainellaceae cyanobacterium]
MLISSKFLPNDFYAFALDRKVAIAHSIKAVGIHIIKLQELSGVVAIAAAALSSVCGVLSR